MLQDADDCSTGKAAAGYAALKCKEGQAGSGKYTIKCASRFNIKNANGRNMCFLSEATLPKGNTCSAKVDTEAEFLAALKKLCQDAKLSGC